MDELLKVLEQLYAEKDNSYRGRDGSCYFVDSELYNNAVALCDDYLITNGGQCNWENIWILRNNGYSVFPGDSDSFGWLTGCVRKNDDFRILVFG